MNMRVEDIKVDTEYYVGTKGGRGGKVYIDNKTFDASHDTWTVEFHWTEAGIGFSQQVGDKHVIKSRTGSPWSLSEEVVHIIDEEVHA